MRLSPWSAQVPPVMSGGDEDLQEGNNGGIGDMDVENTGDEDSSNRKPNKGGRSGGKKSGGKGGKIAPAPRKVRRKKRVNKAFEAMLLKHNEFLKSLGELKLVDVIVPFRELIHQDPELAVLSWKNLFPRCWHAIPTTFHREIHESILDLLSKDYQMKVCPK